MIAAAIAPPVFWLALYLALLPVRALGVAAFSLSMFLPLAVFGVVGVGAAAYGAPYGLSGLADLMGHAFLTHAPEERRPWRTVGLWAGVALACLLVAALG